MTIKEQIIELIKENKVVTQGDISIAIYGDNKHMPNVYSSLMDLVNKGIVKREGSQPAYYSFYEDGEGPISVVINKKPLREKTVRNVAPSKYEFVSVENPYVLDYLVSGNKKIPALTRKNGDFIEAVVSLDSNYNKDNEIIKPDYGFDPEINASNSNNKYSGSTRYWFEEMLKPGANFKKLLLGSIITIDSVNSTHLEAAIDGRKKMRDIICTVCNNVNDLIKKLEEPFDMNDKTNLIVMMSQPIPAKNKGNSMRINLSFATKFCAYAAKYLKANVEYSKYDNVVSKALQQYCAIYLNQQRESNSFLANETLGMSDSEKTEFKLYIYDDYSKSIAWIIDALKEKGVNLSREEIDHIIWYGFKGVK